MAPYHARKIDLKRSSERPAVLDATAQGAAFGAGLAMGFWQDYSALVGRQIERTFDPVPGATQTQASFVIWQKVVERTLST